MSHGKKFNKKIINIVFLFILIVLTLITYFSANFSKAEEIMNIKVDAKDSKNNLADEEYILKSTEKNNEYYIKLPEYINNKKVLKYAFYFEDSENSSNENLDEKNDKVSESSSEEKTNTEKNEEITTNTIEPGSQIKLTAKEVKEKSISISVLYDTIDVDGEKYYYKKLSDRRDDMRILASGYMPADAKLNVEEVNLGEVQSTIRKQTKTPVVLKLAYDIKLKIGDKNYEPYEVNSSVEVSIETNVIENKNVNVWHIDKDNKAEKITTSENVQENDNKTDENQKSENNDTNKTTEKNNSEIKKKQENISNETKKDDAKVDNIETDNTKTDDINTNDSQNNKTNTDEVKIDELKPNENMQENSQDTVSEETPNEEKIENGSTSEDKSNEISFETDEFSIFAIEDIEATSNAVLTDEEINEDTINTSSIVDNILTIDDTQSDKNYYIGKNYTDDISGTERGTNRGIYKDSTLSSVTINYYGYSSAITEADKVGYISLTERQNIITYKKTCPIVNGNISIELIDNPFIDRPTGYGFGGWTCSEGTITKDSKTNVQTLTVTGMKSVTLNVYAKWVKATVVYVDSEKGVDSNDGLTPEKAKGSWGAALQYLRNNSSDVNDREKNIVVMMSDMNTSINYTTPITAGEVVNPGDVFYKESTSVVNGETYIISNGTTSGANALICNNGLQNAQLPSTDEPGDSYLWKFISNGSTWRIQNVATQQYLAVNNSGWNNFSLTLSSNPTNWTYNNGQLYTTVRNGWYTSTVYLSYNYGWTAKSYGGTTIHLLKSEIATETITTRVVGNVQNNSYYTSSTNVAFTLTGLYNQTDYRNNGVLDLTNSSYNDFTLYNDFQLEYIDINASGYRSDTNGTTAGKPYLYGNGNNVRIGRGMYPITNTSTAASTFRTVYGGSTNTSVGSTSNDDNAYKLVVETGKYSQIEGFHGEGNANYYGTVYLTLGCDVDRALNINDKLKNYNRCTVNRGNGINGRSDVEKPAFIINVKSGNYGNDFIADNPTSTEIAYAGIYVGGHGVGASNSVRDISDRYFIMEGGNVANIVGGLKVTNNTNVDTRIYVKGGTVKNIVGGAGYSTTYEDRIIQVTGGTILYSISGGSNGVYATGTGSDGRIENCDTLVYVGGTAQIGTEQTVADANGLYGVAAGCVLGAGNGNSRIENSGQVSNSHIIIDGNAHILNSVYGGGNYGIVGTPSGTSATAKIDILGGIIDGNVYGGANQNHIYGKTIINMKDGQVKSAIYGGSNTTGTVYTSSNINVSGGTLGIMGNTTDNPVLFGGGYGRNTIITNDAIVNITDNDKNVKIYGSAYGGSSLGSMKANVTVNIEDGKNNPNVIAITGYVFGGGKGSDSVSATISGNVTLNIDGSDLPECSAFGGNDINGTTSGTITVNVGKNVKSKLLTVYGGGNKAGITTTTKSVNVYLYENADITNGFNGGKAANLLSSGTSDTTRAIYLQGGKAKNIFGGSDTSGTVTASHVYIQSGNATNVFGGNNEGGTTTTSNVFVTGGTIENVYGGGFQAATTATNVNLTGGTITKGFGGGYGQNAAGTANIATASITLAGSTANEIYGGSNQDGTVQTSYVTINSGIVKDVYGGNNAGGSTENTEVVVNSSAENVYGGGNNAITTGNTIVTLHNAKITGSTYGGGNGSAAVVAGNNLITLDGTTIVQGDVFGSGNAANTGSTSKSSTVTVDIAGATIGGDVYGAANTAVVTGKTNVNIGKTVVETTGLTQGTINISGTVFGGGKSNSAGSDDYDFSFESVIGNTYININAEDYDNGTYTFTIGKSIFGAGNAATMSGDGYVNISNYGSATNIKNNISIQRATKVEINNCGIYLEGTTDRTNEISTTAYSFNRIKELIIKNNSTLYLASGANILEKLTSVDASNQKATVTVGKNGIISKNVDNRIYLLQGKNLVLTTESGSHGEVSGMTYVGLFKGKINRNTGIYSSDYQHGDEVPTDYEEFSRNSYIQGKHYTNHQIEVDGFYTNYNVDGKIETKYIEPTPESETYYQWIIGKMSDDIYYENIELIATKYSTTAAYVLSLDGLNEPNMVINVLGVDTSDLSDGVILKDEDTIPNIEMDKNIANSNFGLTMTAGNTGWQSKGKTEFYRKDNAQTGEVVGTTEFVSDNSSTTPTFSFYMGHSKNVSETKTLGTVTIKLQASYVKNDEMQIKNVYIVITLSTNNTIKLATDYYEGAMSPGKQYSMFPTTTTKITSKSSLSAYYSLYLGNYSTDDEYYKEGYYYKHCLISSCVLPANTKITMIDRSSSDNIRYYYYIVTEEDNASNKTEFYFTEFTAMDSTNEKYSADQTYYNKEADLVMEEFIFQFDFENIALANSLQNEYLIVQLRDYWDNTTKLTVNRDAYPMLFNVYMDKEAIKDVSVKADKSYIYIGENLKTTLTTQYAYQQVDAETVYDTTYFQDQLGVKITILDSGNQLSSSDLTGIYIEHNGSRYYARADGSFRIKLADAVSNILTDLTFYTENGKLESKTYTIKFETFGSLDGIYYSSHIAEDSINVQIINTDYGLIAKLDKDSVIIDKTTGEGINTSNVLNFEIGYSGEFTNPSIHISMYRRDYPADSLYSYTYNLVDLNEYVENNLIATAIKNEYLVTDNPKSIQNLQLTLKSNLLQGTYKVIFTLYDGDRAIGDVEKMIIIK